MAQQSFVGELFLVILKIKHKKNQGRSELISFFPNLVGVDFRHGDHETARRLAPPCLGLSGFHLRLETQAQHLCVVVRKEKGQKFSTYMYVDGKRDGVNTGV